MKWGRAGSKVRAAESPSMQFGKGVFSSGSRENEAQRILSCHLNAEALGLIPNPQNLIRTLR